MLVFLCDICWSFIHSECIFVDDMSGILDSKTRVLDSIITLEGRKQLSQGGINIRYVSFTDSATYYAADVVSGSADPTLRLYLESCHLPQDQITFQADELGKLLPFDSGGNQTLRNGQVLSYAFRQVPQELFTGSQLQGTTLYGDELSDAASGILTGSIDNFVKHMTIGSRDPIFDDEDFAINHDEVEFVITDDRPLSQASGHIANINHFEDVFSDPRFSNLPNFKFLPPINRIDHSEIDKKDHRNVSSYAIGQYTPWGRSHIHPVNQYHVLREHMHFGNMGYMKEINFDPTSRTNNLFIQAFEITHDTLYKLDVIDFGTWHAPPVQNKSLASTNEPGPVSQIFFIGKLVTNPNTHTHTFIHLFTMFFG